MELPQDTLIGPDELKMILEDIVSIRLSEDTLAKNRFGESAQPLMEKWRSQRENNHKRTLLQIEQLRIQGVPEYLINLIENDVARSNFSLSQSILEATSLQDILSVLEEAWEKRRNTDDPTVPQLGAGAGQIEPLPATEYSEADYEDFRRFIRESFAREWFGLSRESEKSSVNHAIARKQRAFRFEPAISSEWSGWTEGQAFFAHPGIAHNGILVGQESAQTLPATVSSADVDLLMGIFSQYGLNENEDSIRKLFGKRLSAAARQWFARIQQVPGGLMTANDTNISAVFVTRDLDKRQVIRILFAIPYERPDYIVNVTADLQRKSHQDSMFPLGQVASRHVDYCDILFNYSANDDQIRTPPAFNITIFGTLAGHYKEEDPS